MKLVMTLLVRDEQDIIRANVDFHLSQGVDFVLATDNRSVDGTPAILEEYQKRGLLRLIDEPRDDYSQSEWVTRMARMAAVEHGADWVINNDADEFWWPEAGNLKDQLAAVPADVMAIQVQRFNFPDLGDSTGGNPPFYERLTIRDARSVNSLGQPLSTKTCHRSLARVEVAQGNHSVALDGVELAAPMNAGVSILHFPARSYTQFANKIQLGGAAYERNQKLDKAVGGTWRRLYAELLAGRLQDHYSTQILTSEALAQSEPGRYVRDERLRDYLRSIG